VLYFYLFCLISILALIEVNRKIDQNNRLFNFLIIVLMFFIGFRDGLGTDYYRYEAIFNAISKDRMIIGDDIGFCLLAFVLKELLFSTEMIFFVFAAISCLCVRKFILDMVKYKYVALLIFFSLYMLPLSFNAMAQGIATGIMLYSFRYFKEKNGIKIILLFLTAVLFHYIGFLLPIIYCIYLFLDTKKKRVWFMLCLILFSFGMILMIKTGGIVNLLPGRMKIIYASYLLNFPEMIDLQSILARLVMLFCVLYGYKKYSHEEKKWATIYITGLVLYFMLYINSLLSTRINLSFKITEIYLIPTMLRNFRKENNRTIVVLVLIVFLGTVLASGMKEETYPYRSRLFDMIM